jgi:penicillin G amidase
MKVVKFIISLSLGLALLYALNKQFTPAPPLGKFFSPFEGFWQNSDPDVKDYSATLEISELRDEVTVKYDSFGIPHIFADNDHDLYLAQGYVTARDRLWQMEFQALAASGRLAEILGPSLVDHDRLQRRKGLTFAAERALEKLEDDPISTNIVYAYTEGVNAYINSLDYEDYPLEYKLLDYEPENWEPIKITLILSYMSNTLSRYETDLENTNVRQLFGDSTFNYLFPDRYSNEVPIIPSGTDWEFDADPPQRPEIDYPADMIPESFLAMERDNRQNPDNGSNNWAVSGSKTATGAPILANDTHLALNLPNIFYSTQLHGPEVNVYGSAIPGVPCIIIGFNDSIAWGVTNAGRDAADWYQIRFQNKERTDYYLDDKLLKTQERIETIKVKGEKDVLDTVIYTHLGPIVYDKIFPDEKHPKFNFAYRWIGHNPDRELLTFYKLNKGTNYDDYLEALNSYAGPPQNFAFASASGDIALKVQGRFPSKWPGQGKFLMDGSRSAYEWAGYIPYENNPMIYNPEQGFVSSANQIPVDSTYPYPIYYGKYQQYRNRRINQRLSVMENISADDIKELQTDNYNLQAYEVLPLLTDSLDSLQLSPPQQEAYDLLSNWNFYSNPNSKAATLYEVWWENLNNLIWDEFENEEVKLNRPNSTRTKEILYNNPTDTFMDITTTTKREVADDLIVMAFEQAVEELEEWKNANGQEYYWADFKATSLKHLTRVPSLGITGVKTGGGREIVNAISSNHGPAVRMIVSMEKPVKAWQIYPGGQSGNPGSPGYSSFINRWKDGKYINVPFLNSLDDETGSNFRSLQFIPKTEEQ